MSVNSKFFKKQTIYNSYDEFLKYTDLSDRVLMFMFYDFNIENCILDDLILKLKSSNTRIYNFKVQSSSQTIKNILEIVKFMEEHMIDTVVAIGEDFLCELLKAVSIFYNNKNIKTLVELESNKEDLIYDNLKETIFFPTTGGCNEVHRFFRIIDEDFSQVTIFDDPMAKIDKIVLEPKISKLSSIEYIMYYMFSIIANLVDIILNENVDSGTMETCKNILCELIVMLENGEKFGSSLYFREKVLNYSLQVSKIIDNVSYGILYLYGNLIESIFCIPRNIIDCLGVEFLLEEVNNKYSLNHLNKYFNLSGKNYIEFLKNIKLRYGVKENLSVYELDNDVLEKLKVIILNFLIKQNMVERYKLLDFNEKFNNRFFDYYLNGVNSTKK